MKKSIAYLLIIFFIISSTLGLAANIYNVETFWYNGESMQLGLWINENIPQEKIIMYDIESNGKILKLNQSTIYEIHPNRPPASIMGFWFKNPITIGDGNNLSKFDYFITKKETDKLDLIKTSSEENFLIYKNNNQ